jgi:hypothetical protein
MRDGSSVARGESDDYSDCEKPADLPVKQRKRECNMKRLVLALTAATMVALSVPANAQMSYYRPAGDPLYYYDSGDRTYYGGIMVTPRHRTYLYDGPRYRYGYSAYARDAYGGPYVGSRSWDGPYVSGGYRYRGWWRGW